MSKYIASTDQFTAKGLAHADQLARGIRGNIYPHGWTVRHDGVIEIPDNDTIVGKLADKARATVEDALANRVIPTPPKGKPTTRPGDRP